VHVFEELRLSAFAARTSSGIPADRLSIRVKRLTRGLQSSVALVAPESRGIGETLHATRPSVVRHLHGAERREAIVYESLQNHEINLLPRLLGAEALNVDQSYLYLEYVPRAGG
jgi:hypothetical protein